MKKILTMILTFAMILNIATIPTLAEYKDTDPIVLSGQEAQAFRIAYKLSAELDPLFGDGRNKEYVDYIAYNPTELYKIVPLIENGTLYFSCDVNNRNKQYPRPLFSIGSKGLHEPWNPFATLKEYTDINSPFFIYNPYFYGKQPTQDEVNEWCQVENAKQKVFAEQQKAAGMVFTNTVNLIRMNLDDGSYTLE